MGSLFGCGFTKNDLFNSIIKTLENMTTKSNGYSYWYDIWLMFPIKYKLTLKVSASEVYMVRIIFKLIVTNFKTSKQYNIIVVILSVHGRYRSNFFTAQLFPVTYDECKMNNSFIVNFLNV
jgi:hypothetical protein